MKNPRRVMAGKMAYERRKAAQDEADKPIMDMIKIGIGIVLVIGAVILLAAGGR
jgi:hypothetical protein